MRSWCATHISWQSYKMRWGRRHQRGTGNSQGRELAFSPPVASPIHGGLWRWCLHNPLRNKGHRQRIFLLSIEIQSHGEKADEFMPERFMDGGGRLLLRSCWRTSCIVLTGSCHMAQEDIGTTEVFGLTVHRKEKLLLSQTRNRTVVLLFRLMQSKRSIQYVYMHECTVSTYKLTDIPVSNSIYMHESTPCMDKLNLCTIYMSRFYTHMQDL
jgi:hypothetical protein